MSGSEVQKIRARLRSYERKLREEKRTYGFYNDGAGKRYHIGPLYMLLGDNDGAIAAFGWFAKTFPDDAGEPGHRLCWSLALHRAGDDLGAARQLRRTMLINVYLLPYLFGTPIDKITMWHGSNFAEPSYLAYIPESYFELWTDADRQWASTLYRSAGFRSVRDRYIEISKLLNTTPPGPVRSRLVDEMRELGR